MEINFEKYPDGLVPAIIQDERTGKVLMMGFMNRAALEATQRTKKATFFSRSKNRLWTKGETSGNFLEVREVLVDCDQDTLLLKCMPAGPVCHTGADTCFGEENKTMHFLSSLENIIKERKNNPRSGSYTSTLFTSGINAIAQKVGEEAVELIIEAKDDDEALFLNEAADLLFHYLILLWAKGFCIDDISEVLKARHDKRKEE